MLKKIDKKNILAGIFLLFLLGRCAYSVGYPWNCEDAKEALQEAETKYDAAFKNGIENRPVDNKEVDFKIAESEKFRAEMKVNSLCSSE